MRQVIDKYKMFLEKKRKKFYQRNTGTQFAKELKFNKFPGILIAFLIFGILIYCVRYVFYISEFLEWFVHLLEIPKVLKLPFLDNKDFYRFPALAIYAYLSLAVLYDLSNFLQSNLGLRWILTDDSLYIARKQWLHWKIIKLPKSKVAKNWQWNRGLLLDLLSLNRITFSYKEKEYTSSFFSPKKNAEIIKKQFHEK
jgi:hypothetical protein